MFQQRSPRDLCFYLHKQENNKHDSYYDADINRYNKQDKGNAQTQYLTVYG